MLPVAPGCPVCFVYNSQRDPEREYFCLFQNAGISSFLSLGRQKLGSLVTSAYSILALLSQNGIVCLSVTVSVLGPSMAPAGLTPLAFLSDVTL